MKRLVPKRDQVGTFLLALVLAVIVWVVAIQQKDPFETRTMSRIPVTARNLPEGLVMTDASSPLLNVDVRLRAPRSVWNILTQNDLRSYVDLSKAAAGRQEIPVTVEPRLAKVDIQEVLPGAAVVNLERTVTKEVPVKVKVVDRPPFGYEAGDPVADPITVTVTAAESTANLVNSAEVTVRLSDARENLQSTELPVLRDGSGGIVTGVIPEPRTVTVRVPIQQQTGVSEKSVLPKLEGQPAPNYRLTGVTAEPTTVTLIGDPKTLAAMPSYVETSPIKLEGATANIEERVPLVLPVSITAATSQSVVVRIGVEPIEGSVTMTLKPVIQGLDPAYAVESMSPNRLDVILQGPLPRLKTLDNSNVVATLDVTALEPGAHAISPKFLLPEGVTLQTVLPETVQVTIAPAPPATSQPPTNPMSTSPTPTARTR